MSLTAASRRELWSIVLAGGQGERTRGFIRRWLGHAKPKQYCTFVGTRSLFQHTVDRADRLTGSHRRVTVAAGEHREEVEAQLEGRGGGKLLLQPSNRGTGPGILLPLSYIRALDAEAVVAVFPSDHFIYPEEGFLETMKRACASARREPCRVLMVGVPPEGLESDYGYIVPGDSRGAEAGGPMPVERFVEKPDGARLSEAARQGGLWNTFIMISRADALWRLAMRTIPEVARLFDGWRRFIGTAEEAEALQDVYRVMPARDFSSQLLERCCSGLGVIEMRGVRWSDWGRPVRIAETLRGLGKRPAFPSELLEDDTEAGGLAPEAVAPAPSAETREPIEPYPGQVAAS